MWCRIVYQGIDRTVYAAPDSGAGSYRDAASRWFLRLTPCDWFDPCLLGA